MEIYIFENCNGGVWPCQGHLLLAQAPTGHHNNIPYYTISATIILGFFNLDSLSLERNFREITQFNHYGAYHQRLL